MRFSNLNTGNKYLGTIVFDNRDVHNEPSAINTFKSKFMEDGDELKHANNEFTYHYSKQDKNEFACKTHRVINYFIEE